ncbi:hypothetical protein [Pseudomonas serbica]|uniref:hypothetical protein n=1 Tax=Pseudomonas serbica TaxID=2965074 RepID=UPI00237A333B|nr:hypothetical protein [Pseudomonas serbica]
MSDKLLVACQDIQLILESLVEAKLYHRVVIQRFKDDDEDGEIARRGCPQIDYRNRKIKDIEALEHRLKHVLDVQVAVTQTAR